MKAARNWWRGSQPASCGRLDGAWALVAEDGGVEAALVFSAAKIAGLLRPAGWRLGFGDGRRRRGSRLGFLCCEDSRPPAAGWMALGLWRRKTAAWKPPWLSLLQR